MLTWRVVCRLPCAPCRWLDKLGILAEGGYAHVFRQTFISGVVPPFHLNYGLLSQQLQPHPGQQ